jgi:hypothetical protein
MFVVPFASTPLLHVRSKNRNVRYMGFTFSDAVVRYGKGLLNYTKPTEVVFKEQLQHNFVVLHHRLTGSEPKRNWIPNTMGVPQNVLDRLTCE